MDSALPLFTAQAARPERPSAKSPHCAGAGAGAGEAGGEPGAFCRTLTAATAEDGAAVTPDVGAPGAGIAAGVESVGPDPGDPDSLGDVTAKPLGSEAADASGATALSDPDTALVQWMLQMAAPPPAPAPAAAAVVQASRSTDSDPAGLNRLGGRADRAGRDSEARVSAAAAWRAGSQAGKADRTADGLAAGSADRAVSLAAPTTDTAKPVDPALPRSTAAPGASQSVSPGTASGTSSGDTQALLSAAALVNASAPAAQASTVTPAGSPVVAPAQTWIQTPVTQPGFSDAVVVEMVRRVGQAEQGMQAVTLHLNPVEMGPVSVSIEMTGSAARIEFGASEPLTRQHLEAALPGLTQALRDEGVSLTHSRVHEASKESLAAGAAAGQASDGSGSDARQRGDAWFDGRSGQGERGPRREMAVFSVDGRAVAGGRVPVSLGFSPGRAGRLDLFA